MEVIHKFDIRVDLDGIYPPVYAVQGDTARTVEMTLLGAGNEPWEIPDDISVTIKYIRPDGTGSIYSDLDGASAWLASGNVLRVDLAPTMFTVPGKGIYIVTILQDGEQISTFRLVYFVDADPTANLDLQTIKIDDTGVYDVSPYQVANVTASGGGMGVSVKRYGAKGDGVTDDTKAFQDALAAERVVSVPGGVYKLSGGITIGGNCCLELSQDTVFVFSNTTGNCITLGMSSWLKGNHATVKVPYAFAGNVIYAYSHDSTTDDILAVEPWSKWDPQWKSGRYVTDLNICKADSRGFHYAVNPSDCKGTAVYISANASSSSSYLTFMWGVHYSGLRIAGAFKYGIRAVNLNNGWLHEMRIDAFIDACEIGVQLEDCQNTYISAIVQPRRAYTEAGEYIPYAKHGIKLVRSPNTDLSGSRVWDWDSEKTLWTDGGEYQSYAMIGDCHGAIINDFAYSVSNDTRKRIYTDYGNNLETLTILQEPITRWFTPVDGQPCFNNGLVKKPLMFREEMQEYFVAERVKGYTDVLANSQDLNGNIYNGIGYRVGYNANTNGTDSVSPYTVVTGFIPCKAGDVIRSQNILFDKALLQDDKGNYLGGNCGIQYYDANHQFLVGQTCVAMIINNGVYYQTYVQTDDGFEITPKSTIANLAYVRLIFYIYDFGENPTMSINEEIRYRNEGFIADGVKVKGESLILTSPGGKAYSLSVSDSGVLTATEITV